MKRVFVIGIVLLVFLVAGFFYFTKPMDYNLSDFFNMKGKVVYSGTYLTDEEYKEAFEKFEQVYGENKEDDKETFFVYGDKEKIEVATYDELVQGKMNLILGSDLNYEVSKDEISLRSLSPSEDKVKFIMDGDEYSFKLKDGEKVYFIVEGRE